MTQNSWEKEMGLLISVVFGNEPALPGLSNGNPVQLKSRLRAKELFLLLPGNLWQGQVNVFQAVGIQVKAAAELIDPRAMALWIGIIILNFIH